jgi:hypothetical protein
MNPDGTYKKYDVIHFRNGYNPDSRFIVVELKEIKIIKEKVSWFRSDKYFELCLAKFWRQVNKNPLPPTKIHFKTLPIKGLDVWT